MSFWKQPVIANLIYLLYISKILSITNQITQARKYSSSLRHKRRKKEERKKENSVNEISNYIIEVALLYKSDNNKVLVSGIIPRSDKLNAKATEVNKHPKNECCKRNISFIVIQILTQSTTVTKVVFILIGKERINLLKISYLLWASWIIDIRHR